MTGPRPPAAAAAWVRAEPFDTDLLGAPVGRLLLPPGPPPALAEALAPCPGQWRDEGLWLVSCRIPAVWADVGTALERAGFRQVETLLAFRRAVAPAPPGPDTVFPAEPADEAACIAIAGRAFQHDRYHVDPHIPNAAADALKAAWTRNAFAGRAEAVLVARDGNTARGFVACLLDGDTVVIDLIAVAPEAQGRGYGQALVAGALAHYAGRAAALHAATQATNAPSTALYHRLDFAEVERTLTYHWVNGAAQP